MASRPRFANATQAVHAASAIRRAINAAGGSARLAPRLGLHIASVNGWTFCPAQHVNAVADVSGVARHDLRPDLFSRPAPTIRLLTGDQAMAAHLMAGDFFARTGRCLMLEEAR